MNFFTLRTGRAVLCFFLPAALFAAEVPNLTMVDKHYDPATGVAEFTLVNRHSAPAVAWSLGILSAESDGGKAKISLMEDRQDFLDPERWVSETPPERGYVPAGGELRQSLKVQPDQGGFAAIRIEVQAVVYEDVSYAGEAQVIDRIFASRVARLKETREALAEIFESRLASDGHDPVTYVLRQLEQRDRRPAAGEPGASGSRTGHQAANYLSVLRASKAADPGLALEDLELRWHDKAQRIEAALRPSDRLQLGTPGNSPPREVHP